jgi:hypothetical protein
MKLGLGAKPAAGILVHQRLPRERVISCRRERVGRSGNVATPPSFYWRGKQRARARMQNKNSQLTSHLKGPF